MTGRDVGALVAHLVEQATGRTVDECPWRELLRVRDVVDAHLSALVDRGQARDRGAST